MSNEDRLRRPTLYRLRAQGVGAHKAGVDFYLLDAANMIEKLNTTAVVRVDLRTADSHHWIQLPVSSLRQSPERLMWRDVTVDVTVGAPVDGVGKHG